MRRTQCYSCTVQRNIKLPGGCHKGELTKLGQVQAREVGEWLRRRYVDQLGFLPAQFEVRMCRQLPACCWSHAFHKSRGVLSCSLWIIAPSLKLKLFTLCSVFTCMHMQEGAVSGRTTNFARTIATLQGVLTGLYPQASEPIPISTASDMDEIMFANVLSCERLADVMKKARYDLRGESVCGLVTAFHMCIRLVKDTPVRI